MSLPPTGCAAAPPAFFGIECLDGVGAGMVMLATAPFVARGSCPPDGRDAVGRRDARQALWYVRRSSTWLNARSWPTEAYLPSFDCARR